MDRTININKLEKMAQVGKLKLSGKSKRPIIFRCPSEVTKRELFKRSMESCGLCGVITEFKECEAKLGSSGDFCIYPAVSATSVLPSRFHVGSSFGQR